MQTEFTLIIGLLVGLLIGVALGFLLSKSRQQQPATTTPETAVINSTINSLKEKIEKLEADGRRIGVSRAEMDTKLFGQLSNLS